MTPILITPPPAPTSAALRDAGLAREGQQGEEAQGAQALARARRRRRGPDLVQGPATVGQASIRSATEADGLFYVYISVGGGGMPAVDDESMPDPE